MDDKLGRPSGQGLIRVSTGARLHFGLYDVVTPYGGIGLMVDHPTTTVAVEAAERFEAQPCSVERLTEIAERIAKRLPISRIADGLPRCKVTIEAVASAHRGLGSGTQLSLSAAAAMSEFFSLRLSRHELVHEIAARGRRSAIGSIGFYQGGLIAEDGSDHDFDSGSTWQRVELPATWRIVLACPSQHDSGVCGEAEGAAFAELPPATPEHRDELLRLGQQIMLSASVADFETFCTAVSKFNARSGDLFAKHQGGSYNGLSVEALVQRLVELGPTGAGQSSWGPTVFGFCRDETQAEQMIAALQDISCRVVKPQASGYVLERSPTTSCK
jgi:beta-ribofuranosylaminobenzene 5'-phosphate synthase